MLADSFPPALTRVETPQRGILTRQQLAKAFSSQSKKIQLLFSL